MEERKYTKMEWMEREIKRLWMENQLRRVFLRVIKRK